MAASPEKTGFKDGFDARIARLSARRFTVTDTAPVGSPPDLSTAPAGSRPESFRRRDASDSLGLDERLVALSDEAFAQLSVQLPPEARSRLSRKRLATMVGEAVDSLLTGHGLEANPIERRDLITAVMQRIMAGADGQPNQSDQTRPQLSPESPDLSPMLAERSASVRDDILQHLRTQFPPDLRDRLGRKRIASIVGELLDDRLAGRGLQVSQIERRNLITAIMQSLASNTNKGPSVGGQARSTAPRPAPQSAASPRRWALSAVVRSAKDVIEPLVLERLDVATAAALPPSEFEIRLSGWVREVLGQSKLQLNAAEQRDLIASLLDELRGLGPLEPLLEDESVNDIMVNGANQVYVERRGKLELTDVQFRDDAHVMNIANRMVTRVGRRIDEMQPLVDARLQDGSRINIIIPPLALDWPMISIRKFSKKAITLDMMAAQGNMSPEMAMVLKIAARCRLNILISGGTGSGKTTLLNALSQLIDPAERIVTIEDAAELQLQQPHVGRLETRPPNLEGSGEITMRDLLRNALRMRPDRIILGEVRGAEALDMLQAMNTGHDGSMSTIHANRPREALTRLENMVGMTGITLPAKAVRSQIASAVHLICQVSRMRDGVRRVTHITEVIGMEEEVVTTHDLFSYEFRGETDGKLQGLFRNSGILPRFLPQAEYFGLDKQLREATSS